MKKTFVYSLGIFFVILVLWILAWVIKANFLDQVQFFGSSFGSFLYWTLSKILIWLLPFIIFFRLKKIKFAGGSNARDKGWLKWGLLLGSGIAIINILYNMIAKQPIWNMELSFAFLNVALLAPLFEEILFRGFILRMLQEEMQFYLANIITSVCFLAIHIPGWFFMGVLSTNFYNFTFVSIFILSLVFGYAYKKGKSVKASIIVHMLNNIT